MDGVHKLELTVKWLGALQNVNILHHKWPTSLWSDKIETYHSKYLGIQRVLKRVFNHVTYMVQSTPQIPSPFTVQTHIFKKHNLPWKNKDTHIIYIDLKVYQVV